MNNKHARDLFGGDVVDTTTQLLFANAWNKVNENAEKYKNYCKTFEKGGILLIKYELSTVDTILTGRTESEVSASGNFGTNARETSANNPVVCFVEDDTDSLEWSRLIKIIGNFHELYINYDPKKQYMMCMVIVDTTNKEIYQQLVKLNYS